MIIGPKGSMIMEIMKKSGVKITIKQDFPKGQPHLIIYTGLLQHISPAHFYTSHASIAIAVFSNFNEINVYLLQ